MRIIITQHSMHRRKHHKITDKEILIDFVKHVDKVFFISEKQNATYKIGYRNKIAIIKKNDNSLLLITVRGFEKENFKVDNLDLKLQIIDE